MPKLGLPNRMIHLHNEVLSVTHPKGSRVFGNLLANRGRPGSHRSRFIHPFAETGEPLLSFFKGLLKREKLHTSC